MINLELSVPEFFYLKSAVERDLAELENVGGMSDDGDQYAEVAQDMAALFKRVEQAQVFKH